MIVMLEDDERRTMAMQDEIRKSLPGIELVKFDNATDMVAWLKDNLTWVRLFCLDHDLGPNRKRNNREFDPGSGRDVADFLTTIKPCCPVLIHSSNIDGAHGMQFVLETAGWTVERVDPIDDLAWIKDQWSAQVEALYLPL
jgi:hypothetical protein